MALHLADHSEVINDSRVKFYYGEEYSGSKANYVFNPAEVNIADDVNWKKRDGLLYRCLSDYSNRQFMTSWGETLVRPGHTEELEKYDGVVDLYNTQKGEHAYVIGAGPTLERNVKRLKSILDINASSVVIVCDTAVSGLIKSGIRIDYVVTTDPEISKTYLDAALCPSTPLVFGVHTPIAYIESWQGPKYFYLSSVKVYDKYPKLVVKGRLFGGGSVIHPATDLAIKLGCESITFIGADFSFPYGKAHSFNDWGVRQVDQNWVLNSRKERVPTNANFAFYLVALEYLIAISPSAVFFNASKDGAKIAGADDDPTFGDL